MQSMKRLRDLQKRVAWELPRPVGVKIRGKELKAERTSRCAFPACKQL